MYTVQNIAHTLELHAIEYIVQDDRIFGVDVQVTCTLQVQCTWVDLTDVSLGEWLGY